MSESRKISERAQKVLTWMQNQGQSEIWLRQASLGELFGCSRTSIWRALKQLKEAGLIVDTQKRHEHRYKIYALETTREIMDPLSGPRGISLTDKIPPDLPFSKGGVLSPEVKQQWERYQRTFGYAFAMFDGQQGRPTLEQCFLEVGLGLAGIKDESELYSALFAGLWAHPAYRDAEFQWRLGG